MTISTTKIIKRTVTFTDQEVEAILIEFCKMSNDDTSVTWDIGYEGWLKSVMLEETKTEEA